MDMCKDTCKDMCTDKCTNTGTDMGIDMCIDKSMNLHMGMCKDSVYLKLTITYRQMRMDIYANTGLVWLMTNRGFPYADPDVSGSRLIGGARLAPCK